MALQTIQFESVSLREIGSGTITAELFQGSASQGTLESISEDPTRNGRFTGTVTSKPAGGYDLQIRFNGITISEPNESVTLALAVGTYVATQAVELDSGALDPVLAAIAEIAAGGLTSEQALLLTQIAERTAQITGSRLSLAGAVTPGGRIQLIVGKDYVTAAENGLTRTIADAGAVLHAKLTSATLAAVKRFGASRPNGVGQITGTISAVTHASGITSITINVPRSSLSDDLSASSDYRYMIERETSTGEKVVEVDGDLTVIRRTV